MHRRSTRGAELCPHRTLSIPLGALGVLFLAALAAAPARAQGSFVNFEEPQVKPLAIARVADHDYLLVCNTPDSSVHIYDTLNNQLVTRVRVGLSPVSILWNSTLQRFYTANFVGDTVTMVQLDGTSGLTAKVLATRNVGDEPADLALHPNGSTLFVTLNGKSALATCSASTLLPVPPGTIVLKKPSSVPNEFEALKEPRRLLRVGNRINVLGMRGNNGADYDFDLFSLDTSAASNHQYVQGKLGSTNMGMTVAADGRTFVVGGIARNSVKGKSLLKVENTGFVQSHLYVLPANFSSSSTADDRDLNLSATGAVVSPAASASMPTDVALLENGTTVQKIFIPSFQTDRILVLFPTAAPAAQWARLSFDIPAPPATAVGPVLSGPRALAIKYPSSTDPNTRLYCLNRLDNSISVFDPTGMQYSELARVWLFDPTPDMIRSGRRFLYNSRLSLKGMVACASCHVDGRTDGLVWFLDAVGDPTTKVIPNPLIDGVTDPSPPNAYPAPNYFPGDRGPMVTQSLQGLVNHPVNKEVQYLFSNKPYHWRGDKAEFTDFNEAFVNLLGAPDLDPGANVERGLSDSDMALYRDMINSIMYPPNPDESVERVVTGDVGSPNLTADGNGAQRGMKLFHIQPLSLLSGPDPLAGRSCVECHALPEGGNTRITLLDNLDIVSGFQPVESAALRDLVVREAGFLTPPPNPAFVRTSQAGLSHVGDIVGQALTIDRFVDKFFSGAGALSVDADRADVVSFLRTMDWGIAPAVGFALTVDISNASLPETTSLLTTAEGQVAKANSGLVVYLRIGTTISGLYFDVNLPTPAYRVEGTSTTITRNNLLLQASGADSVAIFQGVPLGSERRLASATGTPTVLQGVAPSNVALLPMREATQWTHVKEFKKNWNDFVFVGDGRSPVSLTAMFAFQDALISALPTFDFGVHDKHHEPPRRFRVSGDGFLHGAQLELSMTADPSIPPKNPGPVQKFLLDIQPTTELDSGGKRVWETTAELAPIMQLVMLNGGPFAPEVAKFHDGDPTANVANLAPLTWNFFHVRVINENGGASPAGNSFWMRLTVD